MAPPTLPEKIGGRHRDRLAVVYVRQSTLQQVGRHPEFDPAPVRPGRTRPAARLGRRAGRRHRRRPRPLRRLGARSGRASSAWWPRSGSAMSAWCSGSRCPGCPLLPRLAPAARDLRPVRHADRRQRRRLRPGGLQRPPAARPQGHDERGRAAHPQGPHGRRTAGQGRARRAVLQPAARLRAAAVGRGRARSRRAGAGRRSGWSSTCSSGGARSTACWSTWPPTTSGCLYRLRGGPGKGELVWRRAEPAHARRDADQPGLRRRLRLRPARGRPPPPASGASRVRAGRRRSPAAWCCSGTAGPPTSAGRTTSGTARR